MSSANETEFSSFGDSNITDSDNPVSTASDTFGGKVAKRSMIRRYWYLFGICGIFSFLLLVILVVSFFVLKTRRSEHFYQLDGYNFPNDRTFSLTVPEFANNEDNSFHFDGENIMYVQKIQDDDSMNEYKCSAECIFEGADLSTERRTATYASKMLYSTMLTITVFSVGLFQATQNSRTKMDEMCSEVGSNVQSGFFENNDFSHDFQVQGLDCDSVTDERGRYMGHEYNSMHLCKGYCYDEASDKDELLCWEKVGSKTIHKALEDITPLLDELCTTQLGKDTKARNVECKSAMSVYIAGKCEKLD